MALTSVYSAARLPCHSWRCYRKKATHSSRWMPPSGAAEEGREAGDNCSGLAAADEKFDTLFQNRSVLPPIHPHTYPSIYLSLYRPIHPDPNIHSYSDSSIHLFPFIYQPSPIQTHLSMHLSVHTSSIQTQPSIQLSVCPSFPTEAHLYIYVSVFFTLHHLLFFTYAIPADTIGTS